MDEFFIDQRPPLYRRLRTNLQEPAPKDDRKHSKLASTLLEQWAWGEIAAPLLQQLASAAVADGALHPQLISLSKLGHNGQCPGNCHRDLLRYLSGSDTISVPVQLLHYDASDGWPGSRAAAWAARALSLGLLQPRSSVDDG